MTFYLGRPGTVLLALPHPGRGVDADLDIPTKVSKTIGGGQNVDRAPTGRRTYKLDWASLTPDQHSVVEAFHLGANGPGPHVLLDPWRRNHLSANQSAATSVTNDVAGYAASGSETLASVTTPVRRGPRALAWTIPSSSNAGILTISPPTLLTAWPTPALATWTFHAWLRGGGTDPIVTAGSDIVWLDTAGATLSTSTGTTISTASGAYAQIVQTATAPAGAVSFNLRLRVTPATIAAGGSIVYIDQPQLEMNASARAWVVGTGIPCVSVTDAATSYKRPLNRIASLTLAEVG